MFLSLFNLLIFGMLAVVGAVSLGLVSKVAGLPPHFANGLAFSGACASVLLFSWPLYQIFRFRLFVCLLAHSAIRYPPIVF
jgi:hypothetical protein